MLVAGTNGKTSTARMADALLRELGLRVGRYTSPHLERVTERISLDGDTAAATSDFVQAYEEIAPVPRAGRRQARAPAVVLRDADRAWRTASSPTHPSTSRWSRSGWAGRGTRPTSSTPAVAVVTPIGLDHQAYLGDTIEQIAAEKAGILKDGRLRRAGPAGARGRQVLLRARRARSAPRWPAKGWSSACCPASLAVGGQLRRPARVWPGRTTTCSCRCSVAHQAHNAAVALAAVEAFLGGGQRAARRRRCAQRLPRRDLTRPARGGASRAHGAARRRRTTRPGRPRWRAALVEDFSFRRLVAVVGVLDGQGRARPAGGARAGRSTRSW